MEPGPCPADPRCRPFPGNLQPFPLLLDGLFLQGAPESSGLRGDVQGHLSFLSSLQEQFEFALTAVAEEVNTILKAFPQ